AVSVCGWSCCMISGCEHHPKSSGMPNTRIASRKGSYYAGILPPFVERAGQCLQPEIEPRSRDEPGRGRGSPGAALARGPVAGAVRSEEHTSELQSLAYLVCR